MLYVIGDPSRMRAIHRSLFHKIWKPPWQSPRRRTTLWMSFVLGCFRPCAILSTKRVLRRAWTVYPS